MASTLALKVGTTARPLSPNLSRNPRRLRVEAVRIASAYIYGRNIFNKAYRAYTLNLGALGTTSMYAKPATYGVSASFKW